SDGTTSARRTTVRTGDLDMTDLLRCAAAPIRTRRYPPSRKDCDLGETHPIHRPLPDLQPPAEPGASCRDPGTRRSPTATRPGGAAGRRAMGPGRPACTGTRT